ncbi:MAG: hypothetical protein M0Q21_03785 [Ignavibacteriaceae bacterium]|nr:hypothetical protein [Ignavibacteriaceae bacterium]
MDDRTAIDELVFIRKVIEDSKRSVAENGKGYILWGILVFLGLMSVYLGYVFKLPTNSPWVWVVLIGFGWIYTLASVFSKKHEKHVRTFAAKILNSVWLGTGVSMTIIGFIATSSGMINGLALSPLMSTVLGVAYFISGTVYDSKWVKLLALGWWCGGIAMFFIANIIQILIMALMMLGLQVIPGFIFYFSSKKEMK